MDVRKLFGKYPPREELSSLDALVRDWRWRTAPGGGLDLKRDAVVDFCREASSFRVAVYRAVGSRDRRGKMHNHQSKVKESARNLLGDRIAMTIDSHSPQCKTFDDLHDHIDSIKPPGIGPVTVYDVAVRIGAYLGIEPESLHLHAGVRQGWLALVPWPRAWAGVKRVPKDYWPAEVRDFRADDLEDFLCTYRELLPAIRSMDPWWERAW